MASGLSLSRRTLSRRALQRGQAMSTPLSHRLGGLERGLVIVYSLGWDGSSMFRLNLGFVTAVW